MKILHIIQTYSPAIGGSENKIKELSERLVKQGDDVTVFTSNATTTQAFVDPKIPTLPMGYELINGVKVKRFPFNRWASSLLNPLMKGSWKYRLPFNDIVRLLWNGPLMPLTIVSEIIQAKPDIVTAIAFPFLTMYYPWIAKKVYDFPFVIVPLAHPEDSWSFDRPIMERVLCAADAMLSNTEYEKEFLISQGASEDRIHIIGEGIEPREFLNVSGREIRMKYGIVDFPVVGFIGRQEELKGIDTLIKSMKNVWRAIPETRLLIAGATTSYTPSIDLKISSLKMEEKKKVIKIDKFKEEEKGQIFSAVDVVAVPSCIESFGIVYLEAWICGKPVIGCKAGGIPFVIDEGENGLLISYGNAEELAVAIIKLLKDRNLRVRLGENGKKKVLTRYTLDIITNKVKRVYEQLVYGKSISQHSYT